MRILITGARGVRSDRSEPSPPDAAASELLEGVAERVSSWAFGEVTVRPAIETLVAEQKPDVVVHTAAVTFTEEQERAEPVRVFEVNTGRTLNLLEAARRRGLQRFVYVSTGGLYGPGPGRTGAR